MLDGRPEGADAFSLAIAASRAIAASTGLDEMLSAVARRADGSMLPPLTVSIGVAMFPVRTDLPGGPRRARRRRALRGQARRQGQGGDVWMTRRGPGAVAGRDVADLLRGVVTDVGEALDLWSVDLWTFSGDADTLECRAYWCRDPVAARTGDCVGAVIGLDQSHDLRRLVLAAEVVERHVDDDLSPADAAALAQAGFTSRIDVPLLAGAEVLGVLSLAETRAGRRLSPDERALLGTLARLAAPRCARRASPRTRASARSGSPACSSSGRGIAAALSPAEIVAAVREEAARLDRAASTCDADVVLRQDDGTFARAGQGRSPRGRLARRRPGAAGGGPRAAGAGADGRRPRPAPAAAGRRGRSAGYLELTAPLRRPFRRGGGRARLPARRSDRRRARAGAGASARCRTARPRTRSPVCTAAGTSTSGCTPRSRVRGAIVSRSRWSSASSTARRTSPGRAAPRSGTRCSRPWRACC